MIHLFPNQTYRQLSLLALTPILATCLAFVSSTSLINNAVAAPAGSREGFWTKGVQGSPDLETCREAVVQHPDDAVANNDYGWALRMNEQLQQAAKYLQKAISLKPSMTQPYSNLSVVMLELGDVGTAVSSAHKAVSLDPSQAIYRVVLGNALTKQHNLDEAIQQYREALRLKNNYENAHYHLGEALLLKGDNVAAQQELSTAVGLDSKDERAMDLLNKLSAAKQNSPQ